MKPIEQVREFLDADWVPSDLLIVGVDPGANGALAFLDSGSSDCLVLDIPTVKVTRKGGTKTEFDLPAIVALFEVIDDCPLNHDNQGFLRDRVRVAIEVGQVQIAGKGANAYTAFRVGCAYGMWGLFFAEKGWPTEMYHPAGWKRAMGLSKDKEASRQKAKAMFPDASLERKKDEGRAEALLLAEFHRRRLAGQPPGVAT